MLEYFYYQVDTDLPLQKCPKCNGDLRDQGGVSVHVSIGDHEWDFDSFLDTDGKLIDKDDVIAAGYHAGTYCGHCDELLLDSSDEEQLS